jgi:DNA replication protein DnaC
MTAHIPSMLNTELAEVIEKAKEKQKEFMQNHEFTAPEIAEKIYTPKKPSVDLPARYKGCTLDNFAGNEKLISAIRDSLGKRESVYITGKTGCGKTHLAAAIVKEIPTETKYFWNGCGHIPGTVFITAPELLLKARSAFSDSAKMSEEAIIDYYSGCDLLCLDDLGAEKTTEYAITTLYLIIDRRIREERQTIITTNLSLDGIESTLGARVASRLAEMKIIKINMPDYRKNRR